MTAAQPAFDPMAARVRGWSMLRRLLVLTRKTRGMRLAAAIAHVDLGDHLDTVDQFLSASMERLSWGTEFADGKDLACILSIVDVHFESAIVACHQLAGRLADSLQGRAAP